MPDYKEMYLKLFRATESAISCLNTAQLECEELYIRSSEAEIQPIAGFKAENGVISSERTQFVSDDNWEIGIIAKEQSES